MSPHCAGPTHGEPRPPNRMLEEELTARPVFGILTASRLQVMERANTSETAGPTR